MIEHDLVHANGERKVVWRIFEQRVPADIHLMEVDARQERRESERLLVRDEVDLVAAAREGDPELRRHRTGSAVRWVAGDTDLHAIASPRVASPAHRSTVSGQLADVGSSRVTTASGS